MTRSDVLALSAYDREAVVEAAWNAANDAGNGFAVDDADLAHYRELAIGSPACVGALISRDQFPSSDYRLYDDGGAIIAVADASGPWAAVVTNEEAVDFDEIDSEG